MKRILWNVLQFFVAVYVLASCQKEDLATGLDNQTKKEYLVDRNQAREIASYLLKGEKQIEIKVADLDVQTLKNEGEEPYLHVVQKQNGKERSFVIVSGDKRLEPVLAYGDNEFDLENMPEQLKMWMKRYTGQIDYIRDQNFFSEKQLDKFNQSVRTIKSSSKIKNNGMEYVPPLTKTRWGQGCVYNSFSPTKQDLGCDTNLPCDRAYTGCVATCLSQIVFYYKSMDSYNYDIMNYRYESDDLGTTSGIQVGELIKEVGDLMSMEYTCNGSLSYSSDMLHKEVREGLGFSAPLEAKYFNNITVDEIYEEMRQENPIVLSGKDYNNGRRVGHLWIMDGFVRYYGDQQDTVYFHFNMGWDGRSNGWYLYNDFNLGNYNLNHYVRLYYNFRSNNS